MAISSDFYINLIEASHSTGCSQKKAKKLISTISLKGWIIWFACKDPRFKLWSLRVTESDSGALI